MQSDLGKKPDDPRKCHYCGDPIDPQIISGYCSMSCQMAAAVDIISDFN